MDAPTSSSNSQHQQGGAKALGSGSGSGSGSGGGTCLDLSKLASDLAVARQVALELATSAKTSEAMLVALSEAVPEWLHLLQVWGFTLLIRTPLK